MNYLESIVANLGYSKRLGYLFEKDAKFWWCNHYTKKWAIYGMDDVLDWGHQITFKDEFSETEWLRAKCVPTIFTEDALELLPTGIEIQKRFDYSFVFYKDTFTEDKKLSNACCMMIEYLLENGVALRQARREIP